MDKKNRIREHYNAVAHDYGERYVGLKGRYFQDLEEKCLYSVADFRDKCVLDMGTGTGRIALSLVKHEKARIVYGIDISERFIEICHALIGSEIPVHLCLMDGERIGFQEAIFDVVLVIGLFEYVEDLSSYVLEIRRIIKPGGFLIFTCWNRARWFGWRIFDDRMNLSVDHTFCELSAVLNQHQFRIVSALSTLFIPTKLFFSVYNKFGSHHYLQSGFVRVVIIIERMLRNSFLWRKGGEFMIKAQKNR